jgi:hypothetical protein
MSKKYQKEYKEKYHSENKIVTFPVKKYFYVELERRSAMYDISVNSYAKSIVTNSLNSENVSPITSDRHAFIAEYIRISRGIANNINQIAHKANLDEQIDTDILIQSLKHYEDEFKNFVTKI